MLALLAFCQMICTHYRNYSRKLHVVDQLYTIIDTCCGDAMVREPPRDRLSHIFCFATSRKKVFPSRTY